MKQEVKSSLIKNVEHLSAMVALKVEFHTGKKYLYSPVSRKEYEEFLQADSKGKFLNENFRGKGKKVFN